MAMSGILSLLGPASLYVHLYVFVANRVLSGLFEGFASASTSEIFARWAPVQERSRLTSYGTSGTHVGIALTYPICGYLIKKWGWTAPFYVEGAVSFIWSLLWLIFIKNDPSKDKRISKRELDYIQQGTGNVRRRHVTSQFRNIFISPVFWALCIGKMAYSWVFTILLICLPFYVKDTTHRPTEEVGLLSSIPNMVSIAMIPIAGTFIDYWQNHSKLEITQIHKILMGIGFVVGSLLLVTVALISNFTVSMVCFILIKIVGSLNGVIVQVIVLYMAPNNSSIIAGLSAFWYRVSTVLTRTTLGYMTPNHSVQEWNQFFILSAIILFLSAIIFTLYGSSKPQPWSSIPTSNDEDQNPSIENKD
ncbi:vesicular glutamate transporter 2-like isoform X2 [Planococcus citri]